MKRNLHYLNKHRIIYRRLPISDKPTEEFDWGWYYEDGTHQCYTLFASKAKITTFKSLKWHLLVLWYLNPKMTPDEFTSVAEVITNKEHGFTTFTLYGDLLERIIYEVSMQDLDNPPVNRVRKVIFRPSINMPLNEKLSIVGKLIGRSKKVTQDDIYDAMLSIHDNDVKITLPNIAKLLSCSARTIQRNMGEELKREKELLNQQL
jgi:hypothetical protein